MGHGVEATTLRYYNLARTLEAGRMHQRRVREFRREAGERTLDMERERSLCIDGCNGMSAIEGGTDLTRASSEVSG